MIKAAIEKPGPDHAGGPGPFHAGPTYSFLSDAMSIEKRYFTSDFSMRS